MSKKEFLFRRNAVLEALQGERRQLHKLWLKQGQSKAQTRVYVQAAKAKNIPIQYVDKGKLTALAGDSSHQSVVLEAGSYPYAEPEELLGLAAVRGEKPFLLILDQVQGPQNVGMLLRTAEACGVHGVIMQERRAPDITPHVVSFSVGAAEHLLITKVTNLVRTIEWLQENDVWLAALDRGDDAQLIGEVGLNMPLALVVGHEGEGVRRLVRQTCDFVVALPMRGKVSSLNAAIAGSVAMYAVLQERMKGEG